jgi:hypothetical protein
MLGRTTVVEAGDGWLVGFNAGEFGGGLWWANADGSQTKPLTGKNVQAIVPRGKDVLVLTGLAHLSMDEGTIYSYDPAIGKTGDFVRIADVGSAPTAATLLDDGTLLFSTHTGVLKLSTDNSISKLYNDENMSLLYPNSIVTDQTGTIFVGMRFYVLRLERRSNGAYGASWFVRSNCTKVKVRDFDCVCTGKSSE